MPKSKGGLGVINMSMQNEALLLKQLDKFYRKENIQWINLIWQRYYENEVPHLAREKGSFWWEDIIRLNVKYRGVAYCIPNKGDTVGFWVDIINGKLYSESFSKLIQFAKDPKISLWKLRNAHCLLDCFRIPMSREAHNEFLALQDVIEQIPTAPIDLRDTWSFIWGRQVYSSNRYYHY
jgi:hypothetical protein